MKKSVELLIKNDYYVKIKKSERNTVVVTMPTNIFLNKERIVYTYKIEDDKRVTIEAFGTSASCVVPKNALRPLIICDIILKCKNRNMPSELVIAFDQDDTIKKNLMEIVPDIEVDLVKEKDLFKILTMGQVNNLTRDMAKEAGVLSEYDSVLLALSRNKLNI